MRLRAGELALAAMCAAACGIDDRTVAVSPACVSPPPGGELSDFPTARLGRCPDATCPGALAFSPTVSLGEGGVRGLVFPYARPDTVVLALGLTGDLGSVSDSTSALRVVMSYDSLGRTVPAVVGGFAVELADCADTAGYVGVSFRTDGDLGACPLHFAAQIIAGGGGVPMSPPCPLDTCFAASRVAVAPGITMVPFSVPASVSAARGLTGMQWEFGVPTDGARTCRADLTLDDLRLVAQP